MEIENLKESESVHVHSFVTKQLDQSDILATSNKLPDDDFASDELRSKLLPPPYDPFKLSILVESSSILSSAIDVMEVNIDAFGFELVPSVDDETFKMLKEEQEAALGTRPDDKGTRTDAPNRTETEIEIEYRTVTNFFKYVNRKLSYTQLRKRTRRDYELIGNAFWEILRNHVTSKITGIEWLPAHTVRIGRVDKRFTDYIARVKVSDTEIEERPDKIKFRRYAQIQEAGTKPVWYKEFGDPRIMDAETGGRASVTRNKEGRVTKIAPENDTDFPKFNVQKFEKGRMKVATEVIHFANYKTSRSLPYGTPRWIGNLISIIGSRTSEEINLQYFDNKTVPPGMLLVQGGRITKDTVSRITNHIKDNVKGSKNFHSILVVEATAKENQNPNLPAPAIPRLQWVSMKDSQNGDALFQKYDQENIMKVISSFRFWAGYVGRTKEINLATARVAKELSEEQVFQPERAEFDSIINRTLMVEMGVNYWEHKTKGPQLSTPKETAEILDRLKPYLTGDEGRTIAAQILGKDLEELGEDVDWSKRPMALILAELTKMGGLINSPSKGLGVSEDENEPEDGAPKVETVEKFVTKLMSVRKALSLAESKDSEIEMRGAE